MANSYIPYQAVGTIEVCLNGKPVTGQVVAEFIATPGTECLKARYELIHRACIQFGVALTSVELKSMSIERMQP